MKKVFSSPDLITIRSLETFLNSKEIDTLVQGEDRLIGLGGIAPIECWIDLMILDDNAEQEALSYVKEFMSYKSPQRAGIDSKLYHKQVIFRTLVVLDIAIAVILLGSGGDAPQEYQAVIKASQSNVIWDTAGVFELWYLLTFIAWAGLFFFKNFARSLYLGLWLFSLVSFLFAQTGIAVSNGAASLLGSINCCIIGAIISLAYLSPLSVLFDKSYYEVTGDNKS